MKHMSANIKGKVVYLIFLIALLIVIEIASLLWLLSTVKTYQKFWVSKAKQPGEITYLALGNSSAQGIGATSPMRGYVGLITQRLEQSTGKTVRVINISESGIKTADFTKRLMPRAQAIRADLVTIEMGANDIKGFNTLKFRNDYARLLRLLPDGSFVSNLPLFNSRPGSTQPAHDASQIIKELVSQYPKLHFVDLQKQTTEHQSIFGFAPDLFHPNNLSYKNWFQAYWDQIEPTLKTK